MKEFLQENEFIASASHELKSPPAVIVSNLEKIDKLDGKIGFCDTNGDGTTFYLQFP